MPIRSAILPCYPSVGTLSLVQEIQARWETGNGVELTQSSACMKTVDSIRVGQLLTAAHQQVARQLTREYPAIAYEDVQDAIGQATTDFLVAGGLSALSTQQSLYRYLLISAQRTIWRNQKRSACMVRLEDIATTACLSWVAEGMRTDDRASQYVLRKAIVQQIGEENAEIVWRYVMSNDAPQEIAEDLGSEFLFVLSSCRCNS